MVKARRNGTEKTEASIISLFDFRLHKVNDFISSQIIHSGNKTRKDDIYI